MAKCKKYYVIILDNITILFTKNIKQLLFCLYISKEQVMNTSCCRRISNRYRSLPKHKMRVSSHDMVTKNRTEQFSFTFVSPIMNIVFLQNFSACQTKSRPAGELFPIWTRGNNISIFPIKLKNNKETVFIWTAPYKVYHDQRK